MARIAVISALLMSLAGCGISLPKPNILGGLDLKCPATKPAGLACELCDPLPPELPEQFEDLKADYLKLRQQFIDCSLKNACNIGHLTVWDQAWEDC